MPSDVPHEFATSWFDPLYAAADRNPAAVPWADLVPNRWIAACLTAASGRGAAAVVGCGLGDDAEVVAAAGYRTTAFDVSAEAIEWCRERFPESSVEYRFADLLDLPPDMVGSFDLVVEVRTIQSLPLSLRPRAIDAVASLVAPRGTALVVALARPDGTTPTGPAWPVAMQELRHFESNGLVLASDRAESGHFALEWVRE